MAEVETNRKKGRRKRLKNAKQMDLGKGLRWDGMRGGRQNSD